MLQSRPVCFVRGDEDYCANCSRRSYNKVKTFLDQGPSNYSTTVYSVIGQKSKFLVAATTKEQEQQEERRRWRKREALVLQRRPLWPWNCRGQAAVPSRGASHCQASSNPCPLNINRRESEPWGISQIRAFLLWHLFLKVVQFLASSQV